MRQFKIVLLVLLTLSIAWSAVHPQQGYADWFLEIIPVLVGIPVVILLGKRFTLSRLSYILLFIYMLMPVLQAHYGVAHVPLGFRLGALLHKQRNMFDRLTHLSFGLLLGLPLYEMYKQTVRRNTFLHYFLPALTIFGLSAVYEILEYIVTISAGPRLSFLFVATQNDYLDPVKDMAVAGFGIILALLIVYGFQGVKYRHT